MSEVTPVTIWYIRHTIMVTQVNIMVMNVWLTSFSFIVNRPPHSWDKAISDSDLETLRSRSWVWSKGKVIQSAQSHINSLPFHFTSIRPTIPEIELFRNLTTNCTQYPTNELSFHFTSIGPTIPEIWPKECLTLKKHIRNFQIKVAKITVFNRITPKSNQVITMTRVTKLPRLVVIQCVFLTLSRKQANHC